MGLSVFGIFQIAFLSRNSRFSNDPASVLFGYPSEGTLNFRNLIHIHIEAVLMGCLHETLTCRVTLMDFVPCQVTSVLLLQQHCISF
jgi:hypothetical protein